MSGKLQDAYAPSPQRKKRPTNMFKLFGRSNVTEASSIENMPPSMFNFSQDSMASQSQFSQCSQDFTDRFQQCNVGVGGMHSLAGGDDSMLDCHISGGGGGSNDEYAQSAVDMRLTQTDNASGSQSQYQDLQQGQGESSGVLEGDDERSQSMYSSIPKHRGAFTNCRPTALDIPQASSSSSVPLFASGGAGNTPLSALSTPVSSGCNGAGSGGNGHGQGAFFNSCLPPPSSLQSTKMLPPPVHKGGNISAFCGSSSLSRDSNSDKERLVNLPGIMMNPFLQDENTFLSQQALAPVISSYTHQGGRETVPSGRKSSRRPTQSVYIGAFKERPRFMFDFEQGAVLGEGVHSTVHRACRRLDGRSYAIKKLKRKIGGEKEGVLLVKEVMACAALQGCPHMVQYYGCWLEDGHLYIQLEACAYGSMESFVGALLPTASDMQLMTSCQLEMNRLHAERVDGSEGDFGCSGDGSMQSGHDNSDSYSSQPSHVTEFLYSCSQEDDINQSCNDEATDAPVSSVSHYNDFGASHMVRVGIDEQMAWVVLRDMSTALQFMHSKGFAHLDMRPANIFVARSPYAQLPHVSLLQQSGSVVIRETVHLTNPSLPELQEHVLTGLAVLRLGDLGQCCRLGDPLLNEGESRYLPREVLNESTGLDLTKSDMFSLGASVYELMLGRQLGTGGDTGAIEWHELRDGHLNFVVEQRYSSKLVDLLRRLMHPIPASRPSAGELFLEAAASLASHAAITTYVREQGKYTMEMEMHQLREQNEQLRAMLRQASLP